MEDENKGRMTRIRDVKKGLVRSDSSCRPGLCLGTVHVMVHCSCPLTSLNQLSGQTSALCCIGSQNIGKIQSNTPCLMFTLLRCSYIIYLNDMLHSFHGPFQVEHFPL